MRSWVIRTTEQLLERIFALMDINESIHFYICFAMTECELLLGYLDRLDTAFVFVDCLDIEAESVDYIMQFRLEEDSDMDNLSNLATVIVKDLFTTCMAATELALREGQEPKKAG